MPVRVQADDFDITAEIAALRSKRTNVGAVASFIGVMRDFNDGSGVSELTLEHYPGMTEKALDQILDEARSRWSLIDALIVHRVGRMLPADQIVLVVTLSAHREAALAACGFVMDYLKTRAPFWKKERTPVGERWVDARTADDTAAERWHAGEGA
ncbi:MAG: molybdopterin synthase catalytic subunit MoaE [Proteobacteria bacterium]|nr:molybdopterin synthase catalytic subunit MoaE [Burkholderiales bacterium]